MTRQTEHYDKLREHSDTAHNALLAMHSHAAEIQRDLNHGLAHVQTAVDTLNAHDDRDILPAETMLDARNELLAWLDRMGVAQVARTPVDLGAGECDGDCTDGEAAEAIEADRDELCATIERLYDGIDAALAAIARYPETINGPIADATRILRNLWPVTS